MRRTIIKEHPLRDIVLEFDDAVEAPDFEQKALSLYYEAHDKTWALREHARKQVKKLKRVDRILDNLNLDRLRLLQGLEVVAEALLHKEREDATMVDEEITLDVTALLEAVEEHNRAFTEVYKSIDKLSRVYNEDIENVLEDDYLIDPRYFGVLSELYQRYDEISVHTVSLDDDHQSFLGVYAEVADEYWRYFSRTGQVFDRYANLLESSDRVYALAEEIQDKLNMVIRPSDFPE